MKVKNNRRKINVNKINNTLNQKNLILSQKPAFKKSLLYVKTRTQNCSI